MTQTGIRRLHICDGEILCYAVRFDEDEVFVVPLRLPSSECEVFFAATAAVGGKDTKLDNYYNRFTQLFPKWKKDRREFATMVKRIDPSDFIIELEMRSLQSRCQNCSISLGVCELQFQLCEFSLRQGASSKGTLKIDVFPEIFIQITIELYCNSGGVSFNPSRVFITKVSSSTNIEVIANLPGDHLISFRLSGVNENDVKLPNVIIPVLSHSSSVISSAMTTLLFARQLSRIKKNSEPFRYIVNCLFHSSTPYETLRDTLSLIAESGLLDLLFKLLGMLPTKLLDKICNAVYYNVPLCHILIMAGETDLTVSLLECPSISPQHASSCAIVALKCGSELTAAELLGHDIIPVNGFFQGTNALCYACEYGIQSLVPQLLSRIDVNCTDADGNTPLYLCFSSAVCIEIISLLLKTEKILWTGSIGRRNAMSLICATKRCDYEAVKILLESGCPLDYPFCYPLMHALYSSSSNLSRLETVKLLTEESSNSIDNKSETGQVLLHMACQRVDLQCVKILLDCGANVTTIDGDSRSCLHHLISAIDVEGETSIAVLELLLDSPGSSDCCELSDFQGRTPLHYACGCESGILQSIFVIKLLENGSKITPDFNQLSALDYAVSCENVDQKVILRLLRSIPETSTGMTWLSLPGKPTLLIRAIKCGLLDFVNVICRKFQGIDLSDSAWVLGEDSSGNTPLLCALLYNVSKNSTKASCSSKQIKLLDSKSRYIAENMSLAVIRTLKNSRESMKQSPFSAPLHISTARRYVKATQIMLQFGYYEPRYSGHSPISAVLSIPPYDVPAPFDDGDETVLQETTTEIFRLLLAYPTVIDEMPHTESTSEVRNLLQILSVKGNTELLELYVKSCRFSWEWNPKLKENIDHPIMLLLKSSKPIEMVSDMMSILLPLCKLELKTNPALLMLIVQGCIEISLDTPLVQLIDKQVMILQALLVGGISLLQFAVCSTKVSDPSKRAKVADILIRSGVSLNTTGLSSCGTALQEAIRKNMWKTVEILCKPQLNVNASLTTAFDTTPPIILAIGKSTKYPVKATQTVNYLLATRTVKEPPDSDSSIAELCCSKGLAGVVLSLYKYSLLEIPTYRTERISTLVHKAITTTEPVEGIQIRFGCTDTLSALSDIGYLETVIETPDEKGRTPLCKALIRGIAPAVRFLLKKGALSTARDNVYPAFNVLQSNFVGMTDFLSYDCLTELVTEENTILGINNRYSGKSLLHLSCSRGFTKTAKLLLSMCKIDSSPLDSCGKTPLICVLESELSYKIILILVELLLSHHNVIPLRGGSPLHVVFTSREVEIDLILLFINNTRPFVSALLNFVPDGGENIICVVSRWLHRQLSDNTDDEIRERTYCSFKVIVTHVGITQATLSSSCAALSILLTLPCDTIAIRAAQMMTSLGIGCLSVSGLTPFQTALKCLTDSGTQQTPPNEICDVLCSLMEHKDFDCSVRDPEGKTLLQLCFELPFSFIVSKLVSRLLTFYSLDYETCDVNAVDDFGVSALSTLTHSFDVLSSNCLHDCLSLILQLPELNPLLLGCRGTVLHFAVSNQRISPSSVHCCLTSPALMRSVATKEFWEIRDEFGRTPLHCAVFREGDSRAKEEIVKQLVQTREATKLLLMDNDKKTPLVAAIENCEWGCAKLMIEASVEFYSPKDPECGITVRLPCESSLLHMSLSLLSCDDEAVYWVELISPSILQTFNNLDDILDDKQQTVLHISAMKSFTKTCCLLIEKYNCSPYINSCTETPLHSSLRNNRSDCAMGILNNYPPPNVMIYNKQNDQGRTFVMIACCYGHVDVVTFLLRNGANALHINDCNGRTALYHAINPVERKVQQRGGYFCSSPRRLTLSSARDLKQISTSMMDGKGSFRSSSPKYLKKLKSYSSFNDNEVENRSQTDVNTHSQSGDEADNPKQFGIQKVNSFPIPKQSKASTSSTDKRKKQLKIQTDGDESSISSSHQFELPSSNSENSEVDNYEDICLLLLQSFEIMKPTEEERSKYPSKKDITDSITGLALEAGLKGSEKVVNLMVELGCDITTIKRNGQTMLECLLHESTLCEFSNERLHEKLLRISSSIVGCYQPPVAGLHILKRVETTSLCSALISGQPASHVASWMSRLGTASEDYDLELFNFLSAKFETYHRNKTSSLSDRDCVIKMKKPISCGVNLTLAEEKVFVNAVRSSPSILSTSEIILSRYVGLLLFYRLRELKYSIATHPDVLSSSFYGSSSLSRSTVLVMPSVPLLILSSSCTESQEIVLPSNGLLSEDSSAECQLCSRDLFEAAISFGNHTITQSFTSHRSSRLITTDCNLLRSAISKGSSNIVSYLLDQHTSDGLPIDSSLVRSFFSRPQSERCWNTFTCLLNYRMPMTEEGLLFMYENGAVLHKNVFGDTVFHIMAITCQSELLRGFLQQMPSFNVALNDCRNVFGKRAVDYSTTKEMRVLLSSTGNQRRVIGCPFETTGRRKPIFVVRTPSSTPSRLTPTLPPQSPTASQKNRPLPFEIRDKVIDSPLSNINFDTFSRSSTPQLLHTTGRLSPALCNSRGRSPPPKDPFSWTPTNTIIVSSIPILKSELVQPQCSLLDNNNIPQESRPWNKRKIIANDRRTKRSVRVIC